MLTHCNWIYSTSYKKNKVSNNLCKPFKGEHKTLGEFYIVHNGHINFPDRFYDKYGSDLNDSQILVKVLEEYQCNDWKETIKLFCETKLTCISVHYAGIGGKIFTNRRWLHAFFLNGLNKPFIDDVSGDSFIVGDHVGRVFV